jgi:hypothetical protein
MRLVTKCLVASVFPSAKVHLQDVGSGSARADAVATKEPARRPGSEAEGILARCCRTIARSALNTCAFSLLSEELSMNSEGTRRKPSRMTPSD